MQFEKCHSSILRSRSFLTDHVKEIDALRAFRLLGTVDTSAQLGRTSTGESRTQRLLPMKPENLRRHASALGVRIAALVSLGAGCDAAAAFSLAARSLDWLAAGVNGAPLRGHPWLPAAYAEGQPWTPDPRGSRVRSDSPRIPHGKVTKWQSGFIRPCQGAFIG